MGELGVAEDAAVGVEVADEFAVGVGEEDFGVFFATGVAGFGGGGLEPFGAVEGGPGDDAEVGLGSAEDDFAVVQEQQAVVVDGYGVGFCA